MNVLWESGRRKGHATRSWTSSTSKTSGLFRYHPSVLLFSSCLYSLNRRSYSILSLSIHTYHYARPSVPTVTDLTMMFSSKPSSSTLSLTGTLATERDVSVPRKITLQGCQTAGCLLDNGACCIAGARKKQEVRTGKGQQGGLVSTNAAITSDTCWREREERKNVNHQSALRFGTHGADCQMVSVHIQCMLIYHTRAVLAPSTKACITEKANRKIKWLWPFGIASISFLT
jgi:hypothetical protein